MANRSVQKKPVSVRKPSEVVKNNTTVKSPLKTIIIAVVIITLIGAAAAAIIYNMAPHAKGIGPDTKVIPNSLP